MKKISIILSALAVAFTFTSCEKKNGGGIDLGDIVLDGFYVYGDATGSDKVISANSMSAGLNEVDKTSRTGMYEKYIYLEGGKDFALIENSAGNKKFYGANLVEVNYGYDENDENCKNFADNPNMKILQGDLIVGENAPKMRVKESGLYHIVLDNNSLKDLKNAQIIIQKADFGVRGGMNGWGFTAGEQSVKDGSITYSWKDQKLASKGEFKFASCHGWKINLDEEGVVKAEVSFGPGEKAGTLGLGTGNITVEKAGLYDITLTYSPKAGALADSFSYTVTLTQESTTPTTMYIIGNDFGNWEWTSADVVEMVPVHSHEGQFWAIRYMTTTTEFKFCAEKAWNGDFTGLDTNEGFTTPGNNKVAEDGLYMIFVDVEGKAVTVEPAKVYGMGDCWGNWDADKNAFEISTVATATLPNAGNLRMYAYSSKHASSDWWQMEFNIYDGKIVYRATGGDQAAVPATAGQTVTLDFNKGTGTIK